MPVLCSCDFCADCRLDSNQVTSRLILTAPHAFSFDSIVPAYDTSNSRSLSFSSIILTWLIYQPFPITLNTTAFDDSTCRRFGTCTWIPIPRGLPSSSTKQELKLTLVPILSGHTAEVGKYLFLSEQYIFVFLILSCYMQPKNLILAHHHIFSLKYPLLPCFLCFCQYV